MALGGIGVAGFDELFDHRDDLRHVLGGVWLHVLRGDAEAAHVLAVDRGVLVGDRADRRAGFLRRGIDLVVHVGDVARIGQTTEVAAQHAGQHVEHDRAAGVADMHVAVDRRSAQVHGDVVGIERREVLNLAAEAVVESELHGESDLTCWPQVYQSGKLRSVRI